jgi:5-methyltetrahydrofolate--homocysteine methyltransferase
VGLNCALGADLMRAHVAEMARVADTLVAAYPQRRACPTPSASTTRAPDETAAHLREWARSGLVNILGGCCGTTPDHIRAIAGAVEGVRPRRPVERAPALRLSGLEAFELA